MALTRASFGLKGSYLPSVINVVQFIGWAAVNTFIAATSISYILHDVLGWPVYGKPGGLKGLVSGIVVMSILHLLSISMGENQFGSLNELVLFWSLSWLSGNRLSFSKMFRYQKSFPGTHRLLLR